MNRCTICKDPALDSITVEAGNNAEVRLVIHLCHFHVEDMAVRGSGFDKQYAELFNRIIAENYPV